MVSFCRLERIREAGTYLEDTAWKHANTWAENYYQ